MLQKVLSVFLAMTLVAGFAVMSKADVTGSLDIDITLTPEGTQTEAVKLEIDLQSNLQVNITMSGLTLGADLGFGTTGVEFAILSLTTNLGALAVFDQFVFASPFGCTLFSGGGNGAANGNNDVGAVGSQCPGNRVVPIGDGDGDGVVDNAVGFVKKRIQLELNIAGITLTNLAIFEDVDFPDISSSAGHEPDHFDGSVAYDLSGTNTLIDDQTPTFGFGDVISISGQTVSGITVTGATAICASGVNRIKKRSFTWEVNKACTAQFGDPGLTPLEGGAKTPLLFEEEILNVEGIEIGGVTIDINTTFVPLQPLSSDIITQFTILDLADVTTTLSSNNITNLSLSRITTSVSSGNLSLTLVDDGGNLQFEEVTAVLAMVLNPNQNPADLTISLRTDTTGLNRVIFSLGISRGVINLDTTTVYSGTASQLEWASTSFSLSVDSDGGLSFGADFSYTPNGMGTTTIELGVVF